MPLLPAGDDNAMVVAAYHFSDCVIALVSGCDEEQLGLRGYHVVLPGSQKRYELA